MFEKYFIGEFHYLYGNWHSQTRQAQLETVMSVNLNTVHITYMN